MSATPKYLPERPCPGLNRLDPEPFGVDPPHRSGVLRDGLDHVLELDVGPAGEGRPVAGLAGRDGHGDVVLAEQTLPPNAWVAEFEERGQEQAVGGGEGGVDGRNGGTQGRERTAVRTLRGYNGRDEGCVRGEESREGAVEVDVAAFGEDLYGNQIWSMRNLSKFMVGTRK
ncbi:hypothetical protein BC938DRAFT_481210 [Jimgerdemannia flammicorona]|uniref:Uncharacterized protein n=1 Tax=Jimgerdemannia flammicorona TaxID=994334 RepID=A0A433QGW6_9FUNG|nr:hypothetical protein BC938DRAFT_481210 [Jimgerdemannia flammicorona]